MKLLVSAFFVTSVSLNAATVISTPADFIPSGGASTTDITIDSPSLGDVTFTSVNQSSGQGSGVSLDAGDAFSLVTPTTFTFAARVNANTLEVFFGRVGNQPQSADGRASDTTAFSLGLSTAGVRTFERGTESATEIPGLTRTLMDNDVLNFEVVVTPVDNNGNLNMDPNASVSFDYDVKVTDPINNDMGVVTGIRANQNPQNPTSVGDYLFNGVGTQTTTNSFIGPVTITSVPEPSAALLGLSALLACSLIRRRA